jgi:hypothetical protein
MPNTVDLAFEVFGQPVVVRTPAGDAAWISRLYDLMGPYRLAATPQHAEVIGVEYAQDPLPWHVTYDKYTNMLPDADQLVLHLEWRIFAIGALHAAAMLCVHAGAAERDGMVVLLPGASGAGKSTLTLALAARGWRVLTDDIALLRMDGEQVLVDPCFRCCHLAPDALAQLKAKGVALAGPLGGLSEYYRPAMQGHAAPVRWIVAPRYAPQATPGIVRLTQAETAALLIGASLRQLTRTTREQWAAGIKLACQAPGVSLTFPTLDAGLEALAQVTREL